MKMNFEEALKELKNGKQVQNDEWNGNKLEGRMLYLRTVLTPEQELPSGTYGSEDYIEMVVGTCEDEGWVFKRFPWLPSQLDLFSDSWSLRQEVDAKYLE